MCVYVLAGETSTSADYELLSLRTYKAPFTPPPLGFPKQGGFHFANLAKVTGIVGIK